MLRQINLYSEASTVAGNYFADFSFGNVYANNSLSLSGSLKLLQDGNTGFSTELKIGNVTDNISLTLPATDGNANDVIISDGSGVLSFLDINELIAPSKAVRFITGSHPAQNSLAFDNTGHDLIGDNVSNMTQASTQGATLDIYVNGQLLVSGSDLQIGAGATRDYAIQPSGNLIKFAFDLEADDVVQVIQRLV